MTFNNDTMVEECFAGNDNVPKVSYNLVPLSQIAQMEANAVVGELKKKNETELIHFNTFRLKMLVASVVMLVKFFNSPQRPVVATSRNEKSH